MQYTKDIILKKVYKFKYRNKYKYIKNVENLYLKLVIIISVSALIADYYVVKQFINLLNEF